MEPCLINQTACGRVRGKPICPKCGMDERVVYPGQTDREAAQTAGLARYWEAHAKAIEQQQIRRAKRARQARQAQQPSPPIETPSPPAPPATPLFDPGPQPSKSRGLTWAWVPIVVAGLTLAYFKHQKEQERQYIEQLMRAAAQNSSPSLVQQIPSGAATEAAVAAAAQPAKAAPQPFEPAMVRIRAGRFTMGSPASEPERDSDEGPQRTVRMAAFDLGKTEVTFAQWDACVADGGCSHKPDDEGWGRGNRPVIRVSWNDITQQYLPWLNRKTGKNYRLPSEAEWEYAARAGCSTPFNLGGRCSVTIEPSQANFDGNYSYTGSAKGAYLGRTAAVASYPANGWGLHDMHGNVWEWVQDCYEKGYDRGQPTDGGAHRAADSICGDRVLRGGSWDGGPQILRSANRGRYTPDFRIHVIGFRLARTVS